MTDCSGLSDIAAFSGLTWDDVLKDPVLQDLPSKVELDDEGRIILSPLTVARAVMWGKVMTELKELYGSDGYVLGSLAVQCVGSKRVIGTDAAWGSKVWFSRGTDEGAVTTAPEHCVEIMSIANTPEQMADKAERYLEAGAKLVWMLDCSGAKTVFTAGGSSFTAK